MLQSPDATAVDRKQTLKPFRKVRTELKHLQVRSPDAVHKFRTNLRRVEAALDATGLDSSRIGSRLLKNEKRFRQRAGKVRDRDVLIELTRSLKVNTARKGRSKLLQYLAQDRNDQAAKLKRLIRKRGQRLRKQLKAITSQIKKVFDDGTHPGANDEVSAARRARVLELCLGLSRYPSLGRANLHEFRLQTKCLRNILQMDRKARANGILLRALADLKDKAGEWHDWEELIAIAQRKTRKKDRASLLAELKRVADKKLKDALQSAKQLRSRHLSSCRWDGSPVNLNAVKRPALVKRALAA